MKGQRARCCISGGRQKRRGLNEHAGLMKFSKQKGERSLTVKTSCFLLSVTRPGILFKHVSCGPIVTNYLLYLGFPSDNYAGAGHWWAYRHV